MAHDVFISYATEDKRAANAVCTSLEATGIQCWIASRDASPGVPYPRAIIDAISESRVLVLVLSSSSNESNQVPREVERAASRGIPILPFRIEDVAPSKEMELFISGPNWLDAFTSPLEQHLVRLSESVERLLGLTGVTVSESVSEPAPPAEPDRVEGRANTSRRTKRPSSQKRNALASRGREAARAPEETIFRQVQTLIAEQLGVDRAFVQFSSSFEEDLRADSLTLVELVMALEEVFNLPDITEEDADRIKTVGDIVNYILDRR